MSAVSVVGRPVRRVRAARRPAVSAGWLVTFADLAAVMVAFFVLLFSMSELDIDRWNGAVQSLDRQFDLRARDDTARPVADLNITQLTAGEGDALGYLEGVIAGHLREQAALAGARLAREDDLLTLSLPTALLFASGEAALGAEGQDAVFLLGGVLARLDNDVEVVGHADPRLVQGAGGFETNWELSIARAAAVARALSAAGVRREMRVFGAGASRYAGTAADQPEPVRRALARRVDIVVRARAGGVR